MSGEGEYLWLSSHAKNFHFKETSYENLCNNKLHVTNAFKEYQIPPDIDWKADPFNSKSWRLYFHSLDWLHSFRYGIMHLDSVGKLNEAFSIIFDWWDKNSNPLEADTMAWDDHATANRLANLCFWFLLSDESEEKEKIIQMINFHTQKILDFHENGYWISNNHGIFHIASLVNVNIAIPQDKLNLDCNQIAQTYLNDLLDSIIHKDSGCSTEQSIFYHQFVIREFKPLIEVISHCKKMSSKGIKSCVNKMIRFLDLISTDSGNVPALGDTAYGFRVDKTYKSESRRDTYSHCFKETGIAIFGGRSPKGQNLATFSFPKNRSSHGHFSPLNFTLILDDNQVLVDSGGAYAYGEEFRFRYVVSNFAHNTITVDGINSKRGCDYIDRKTGTIPYVTASTETGNSNIKRTVLSVNGQMFVIFDEVSPSDIISTDSYWHLPPGVKKINDNGHEIDKNLQFQKLGEKSHSSKLTVGIEDSEYLISVASSNLHSRDLCFGLSGSQPQGWVTPRFRTKEPSHCLVVSNQKVNSSHSSTIVVNQELDYDIISQSPHEIFLLSGELGKVRIYMTEKGPKFDHIR